MARKITIMFIPEKGRERFTITLPQFTLKVLLGLLCTLVAVCAFVFIDYTHLSIQRSRFSKIQKENKLMRTEAQYLSQNLEEIKKYLSKLELTSAQIQTVMKLKLSTVQNKTGINTLSKNKDSSKDIDSDASSFLPLGINLETLVFSSLFTQIDEVQLQARLQTRRLQSMLTSLTQQKNLLSSIPTKLPVNGGISSGYGLRKSPMTGEISEHRGIDIAAATGTPIYAPADGEVIFSGWKPDFGNFIMIKHHGNGIVTKYGHNAENMVTIGQMVSQGDQIASLGQTGNATGPHLHYEVWVDGQHENPLKFIFDSELDLF